MKGEGTGTCMVKQANLSNNTTIIFHHFLDRPVTSSHHTHTCTVKPSVSYKTMQLNLIWERGNSLLPIHGVF